MVVSAGSGEGPVVTRLSPRTADLVGAAGLVQGRIDIAAA